MQSALEAWPGCFLRGRGACGTGLGRPASRKKPSHRRLHMCVLLSSGGGVGWGGVGGAAARGRGRPRGWGGEGRSPPPGLGTGGQSQQSKQALSFSSVATPWVGTHTHTLSRTQEVFSTSLLKPVGSLAWSSPPWMNPLSPQASCV